MTAAIMRHKPAAGGFRAVRLSRLPLGFWILLLCMALVLVWIPLDRSLRPGARAACREECRRLVSEAAAEGVARTLEAAASMDLSLTVQHYDESGTLTGVQADSAAMNTIQTMLLQNVNAALAEREGTEFSISAGTLTGLYTLSGRGPDIPLRFSPRGSANVRLESSFESGGVNQTVYRISAVISAEAACTVPLYEGGAAAEFTYLLCEILIVGDVPSVMWGTETGLLQKGEAPQNSTLLF